MEQDFTDFEFFHWRGKAYAKPPDAFLIYELVENKRFYFRGQISTFFNEAESISREKAFELAKKNRLMDWLELDNRADFAAGTSV